MKLLIGLTLLAGAVAESAAAQPPRPPAIPASTGSFWYGAPSALRDRLRFVDARLIRLRNDHHISPSEFQVDHDGVVALERQDEELAARSGGRPNPRNEVYLSRRLDALSQRIHWDQRYGY